MKLAPKPDKRCPNCKRTAAEGAEFHRCRSNPDGLQYSCVPCHRERAKRHRDKKTEQHLDVEEFDIDVVEPSLARERLELARLRRELAEVRARAKEMEKLALTSEGLRELIGGLGAPNVQANPEWLKGAATPGRNHGTAMLILSDLHFDEVVVSEQVGGVNEYNREIATRRIRNTFKSTIKLLKGHLARSSYDGIVVMLGGDIFSGGIHDELRETNEAPILVSMQVIEPILLEGLGGLADEFGKVFVPAVTGNHGRQSHKPKFKNRAWENYEWSLYHRLASHFRKDSRLTFQIPDGPDAYFSVYKKRYCLSHGDAFRGGQGIGGVLIPILRGLAKKQVRQQGIGDTFHTLCIGHFHCYTHQETLVINGSTKGVDEFSYALNMGFERPTQALWVDHPELGSTVRWPVLCDYEA